MEGLRPQGAGESRRGQLWLGVGALCKPLLHTILTYGLCPPSLCLSSSNTTSLLWGLHPQAAPQFPQLPVVAVSNSIVLLGTEANGVINYLLSAGLSSECDQYHRLSFRAARLCSPSPTPTAGQRRSGLPLWPSHLIENRGWGLGPGMGLLPTLGGE